MSRLILAFVMANTSQNTALRTPPSFLGSHLPFCDHDVVLFDHPGGGDGWATHKRIVLYFLVKRVLSNKMKCARHFPLDIFGQARQDLLVVGLVKAVQVSFDGFLVLSHASSPVPVEVAGSPRPLDRGIVSASPVEIEQPDRRQGRLGDEARGFPPMRPRRRVHEKRMAEVDVARVSSAVNGPDIPVAPHLVALDSTNTDHVMGVPDLATLALGYLVLGILRPGSDRLLVLEMDNRHSRAVAIAGRLDAEIALVGRSTLNPSSVHLDMLSEINVGVDGGEHDRIVTSTGWNKHPSMRPTLVKSTSSISAAMRVGTMAKYVVSGVPATICSGRHRPRGTPHPA